MTLIERLVYQYDKNSHTTPSDVLAWLAPLAEDARAEACGALRKSDLEHGKLYHGFCRLGSIARWNAELQKFVILNHSAGHRVFEYIRHADNELAERTHYEGFRPNALLDPTVIVRLNDQRIVYPLEVS